jgi:hypothetical protein
MVTASNFFFPLHRINLSLNGISGMIGARSLAFADCGLAIKPEYKPYVSYTLRVAGSVVKADTCKSVATTVAMDEMMLKARPRTLSPLFR